MFRIRVSRLPFSFCIAPAPAQVADRNRNRLTHRSPFPGRWADIHHMDYEFVTAALICCNVVMIAEMVFPEIFHSR